MYLKTKDGTELAYWKMGSGRRIILVGGSLTDHLMYKPLAEGLGTDFTAIIYDRRGRGLSISKGDHTVERELEDLQAIVGLEKGPTVLYGHSAGTALAIRAAASGIEIDALILSDLPFSVLRPDSREEEAKFLIEATRINDLLSVGDASGAIRFFLKDFGMTSEQLDGFLATDQGQKAVSVASTLPIDYQLLGNGCTPAELLSKIIAPCLLLASESSREAAEDAAKYLDNSKIEHLGCPVYESPPNEIAQRIIAFLTDLKR